MNIENIKEWKNCQLVNILKQKHGVKCFVFKNKKEKIKIQLSSVNFESNKNQLFTGVFYDIDKIERQVYAIGLSKSMF